jgi:2',3'-cyclic-nucleotide 2'-phosphodiesterase/3'-nucleotidase/5'-nucleotidase
MALINQGGLRADLPRGRITYGQVYDVMPFDNKIVSVRLRGSQLKELIKLATSGGHGWMHFSGVTITLDPKRDIEKPPALRNRVVHVEFTDGSPIRNSKTYTVVTNDFLLQGGDGLGEFFEKIPEARKRITDVIVREYIADWFRERKNQGPLKCVPEGTRVNLL